ncbi:hypothetical protein ACP8HI_03670 [Paenibacillus sp. FA6]|uniref:hypothetical protein n=1 Tax=Paenibacillus sp. FA6 TaxID=3413029 RepID=UPI003F65A566
MDNDQDEVYLETNKWNNPLCDIIAGCSTDICYDWSFFRTFVHSYISEELEVSFK